MTFGELAKMMHPQTEKTEDRYCEQCELGVGDCPTHPLPTQGIHPNQPCDDCGLGKPCAFCPAPSATWLYGGHKPLPVCGHHYDNYHSKGMTGVPTSEKVWVKPEAAAVLNRLFPGTEHRPEKTSQPSDELGRVADEVKQLTLEKNEAYGDSFAKSGDFLRILYPQGIKPSQYEDILLQVRIFDKQMRIATRKDALGESPYRDIAGYGLLGARKDKTS